METRSKVQRIGALFPISDPKCRIPPTPGVKTAADPSEVIEKSPEIEFVFTKSSELRFPHESEQLICCQVAVEEEALTPLFHFMNPANISRMLRLGSISLKASYVGFSKAEMSSAEISEMEKLRFKRAQNSSHLHILHLTPSCDKLSTKKACSCKIALLP